MFDPGGSTDRQRGCPFLAGRHALGIGWARLGAAMVAEAGAFLVRGGIGHHISGEVQAAVRIAVDRCFSAARLVRLSRESPKARGYVSCEDKLLSENAIERGA